MFQENCKSDSYVKMPSKEVIILCENTIKWIEKHRADKIKSLYEKYRQEIMNQFFHKLFKRPVPTDKEVEECCSTLVIDPLYFNGQMCYRQKEAVAYKILHICQFSEEIYLSSNDLYQISK